MNDLIIIKVGNKTSKTNKTKCLLFNPNYKLIQCDLLCIRKWSLFKISSNVEEWKLTFQYDRSNVNDQHLSS